MILYAIASSANACRGVGLGLARTPVRATRAGGAWVVYEDGDPPPPEPAALRRYDRVLRRVARGARAVLPFRYGTTAPDRASLEGLLEPITPAIRASLEQVATCVQYTLRVYGEALPPAELALGEGPGARWLAKRVAAERVPEIADVSEATAPWVRAARVQRSDRAPLVASVYHLVPRKDARAYRAALARTSRGLPVRVEASGPWPPYAFAELP